MLTIGVDVGGSNVRAGVVDVDGTVREMTRASTPGQDQALESTIAELVNSLLARHPIGGVGLALAGFVTPDLQTVRFAPHLSWRDAPVAQRLASRCGLPVTIEHDANAAALAERRFGAAREPARSVLLLTLGTGIGAALLVDGRIYRGGYGVAAELGHLRVVPDGRACPCGKRGCWERYCSGTGLVATFVELLAADPSASSQLAPPGHNLTGRQVAAAAGDGDPLARRAMNELAHWLGEGLVLIADVYDPELIVIGGAVAGAAPLFLDQARERYAHAVTGGRYRTLARIRTAELGEQGGMIGAAQLAREHVVAGRDG